MKKLLLIIAAMAITAFGLYNIASAQTILQVGGGGTGWGQPGGLKSGSVLVGNGIGKVATSSALQFDSSLSRLTVSFASSTAFSVSSILYSGTASTTNLTVSGVPGCSGTQALTTNSSGVVACATITSSASFPFTVQADGNATSTQINFLDGWLSIASSTMNGSLYFSNIINSILTTDSAGLVTGSSTLAVNRGGTGAASLTSGDILVGAGTGPVTSTSTLAANKGGTGQNTNGWTGLTLTTSGVWSQYAGTSCTNQFVRSLDVSGAATCATVANTDLANSTISGIALGSNLADLTATNSTLTFSGTYNGSAARTIGLNLSNPNTWAALQQFGNASSTLLTGLTAFLGNTATSTFWNDGRIGIASSTPSPLWGISIGTTTQFGGTQVAQYPATTTSAAAYTVNWQTGNYQDFTLNQNANFIINSTSSNPLNGGKYILRICQNGTGNFTSTFVTPGQLRWAIGTTSPSLTANTCTFIGMIYDAKAGLYQVIASSTSILAN